MSSEPKFSLYSDVLCQSTRADHEAIAGKRVGVIDRHQGSDGVWRYKVSPNDSYQFFECSESELAAAAPIPFTSDEEILDGLVPSTADLRHSIQWEGFRSLLRERDFDPLKCLLLSVDQGDDVAVTLMLPDGQLASADFREHHQTRQAIRITRWSVENYSDREVELQRTMIALPDSLAFDVRVRAYYDKRIASHDKPLPPLKWGDRLWHSWEEPPST